MAFINDRLVASAGGQGFGGDPTDTLKHLESDLIPPEYKPKVNLLVCYEVNDVLSVCGELEYVSQEVEGSRRPTSPQDASAVDSELGEINRLQLAGNVTFDWSWESLSVGVQTRYQSKQLLRFVEIQDWSNHDNMFNKIKVMLPIYVINLNFNYATSENVDVYGGVNNITNEKLFITNYADPASIRG